jgi:hypothetical protein
VRWRLVIPSIPLKEALVDHHTYYFGWDFLNLSESPTAFVSDFAKKSSKALMGRRKQGNG